MIRRSAEWRSDGNEIGLSTDEREFLTALAAKRTLVTDRARYAEYATAASQGVQPMPVARPQTARVEVPVRKPNAKTNRPASAANPRRRWTPTLQKTPEKVSTHESILLSPGSNISPGSLGMDNSPLVSISPFVRGSRWDVGGSRDVAYEKTQDENEDPEPTKKENRRRELFVHESGDEVIGNVSPTVSSAVLPSPGDMSGWRDSLRGARLRRHAKGTSPIANVSADEPSSEEPSLSPSNKKSNRVSLDHLSSVRLTSDERAFLARLAEKRSLVTDRARGAAAATATGGGLDVGRASPFRASLADPIVAQPPPPARDKGHRDSVHSSMSSMTSGTRSSVGISPSRFRRAAIGDDELLVSASVKKSPARRYQSVESSSGSPGALVSARWRPTHSMNSSNSFERPATAATRMSREHAARMWRRDPVDPEYEFDFTAEKTVDTEAQPRTEITEKPKTRDLETLKRIVTETPVVSATRTSFDSAKFTRAQPPTSASWHGPETTPYRYDVYSRGLGVSIAGVVGSTKLNDAVNGTNNNNSMPDENPEWEWQGSWQREWQSALESPVSSTRFHTENHAPVVSGLGAELVDDTPVDDDERDFDSPTPTAWTLSPSEKSFGAYSVSPRVGRRAGHGDTPSRTTPPRGSPLRSPISMSPAAFSQSPQFQRRAELVSPVNSKGNSFLCSSPQPSVTKYPTTESLSYKERRDLRKASQWGESDGDVLARTGLDVHGKTSDEHGVFF